LLKGLSKSYRTCNYYSLLIKLYHFPSAKSNIAPEFINENL